MIKTGAIIKWQQEAQALVTFTLHWIADNHIVCHEDFLLYFFCVRSVVAAAACLFFHVV